MDSLPQDVFVEDDEFAHVNYLGNWTPVGGKPDLYRSGSYHQTNDTNASATLTFTGSFVAYYSDYNTDHGNFTISLDGHAVATRSSFSTALISKQQIFSMDVIHGLHSLTVTNDVGGGVVGVDYFVYRTSSTNTIGHLPDTSSTESAITTSSTESAITTISTEISYDGHIETPAAAAGGGGGVRLDPAAVTGIALGAVAGAALLVLCAIVLRERMLDQRRVQSAETRGPQQSRWVRNDASTLAGKPWLQPMPGLASNPKSHRHR